MLELGMIPRYCPKKGKRYSTEHLKAVLEEKSIYFLFYLLKLRPFNYQSHMYPLNSVNSQNGILAEGLVAYHQ